MCHPWRKITKWVGSTRGLFLPCDRGSLEFDYITSNEKELDVLLGMIARGLNVEFENLPLVTVLD
jgi:hypothetical protein